MIRFIFGRLVWSLFVLLSAVTLVFFLMFGVGDPCTGKLGNNARADQLRACRQLRGYDQPLWIQFAAYVGVHPTVNRTSPAWHENREQRQYDGILQGTLGRSLLHGQSVAEVIGTRLPRTILLGVMAMGFELLLGVGIGIFAAVKRNTAVDSTLMGLTFLGISAPSFLTGVLFLYVFSFRLAWFPIGGYGVDAWDHIRHGLLPAFTLAILGAATYARVMRGELLEALRSDYVRTARAKGAGPWRVVLRHGVRNALLPVVTLAGLQVPMLVSGAIITEEIFAWPGVGRLALESLVNSDAPMVVGVVMMVALSVQAGNLLADVGVAALDPRTRQ